MSLKRKATHPSVLSIETPDAKRRRGPTDEVANATETPQRTAEYGLEFLQKLRASQDKHGSRIAKHFETLPDPAEYPDYYEQIKLPIAIDTVERKLRAHEYLNMTAVESDLKRMIKNAKTYNEKTAEAYNDAEKIRKMMSNSMKSINPAYADPAFTVDATPLPGEVGYDPVTPSTPAPVAEPVPQSSGRPKRSLTLNGPKDPTPVESTETSAGGGSDDFRGKTFQQAQEFIISELINLKDDDGVSISANFHDKPPRSLKDYYEVIKKPQSLKIIRKQVNGWVGAQKPPTGVSNYKSWQEFEEDLSLIWSNAREYNEPGSEIVELASQVEEHFQRRLAEAKTQVPDPAPTKIRLRVSAKSPEPTNATPKLTLNGPKPAGVAIDENALRRQQELVKAGASGSSGSRPSSSALPNGRPTSAASNTPSAVVQPNIPLQSPSVVKAESQTPAPQILPPFQKPQINGSTPSVGMAPPPMRPSPHSFHPGTSQSSALSELSMNRFRAPGKTAADGILADVELYSHPGITGLDPADRIHFTALPEDTLTQQSFTFYVSHQHLWLQLHTVKKRIEGMRQIHLYCFVEGKKIQPSHPENGPGKQVAQPGQVTWEINLAPGFTTRIEVHAIASSIRGAPRQGNSDLEFEKEHSATNQQSLDHLATRASPHPASLRQTYRSPVPSGRYVPADHNIALSPSMPSRATVLPSAPNVQRQPRNNVNTRRNPGIPNHTDPIPIDPVLLGMSKHVNNNTAQGFTPPPYVPPNRALNPAAVNTQHSVNAHPHANPSRFQQYLANIHGTFTGAPVPTQVVRSPVMGMGAPYANPHYSSTNPVYRAPAFSQVPSGAPNFNRALQYPNPTAYAQGLDGLFNHMQGIAGGIAPRSTMSINRPIHPMQRLGILPGSRVMASPYGMSSVNAGHPNTHRSPLSLVAGGRGPLASQMISRGFSSAGAANNAGHRLPGNRYLPTSRQP